MTIIEAPVCYGRCKRKSKVSECKSPLQGRKEDKKRRDEESIPVDFVVEKAFGTIV